MKNEVYNEKMDTLSETETNKNKPKLKQINFEEAVQMMFYKKFSSKHSFQGCSYSNTNKYIYMTLVKENLNLNSRTLPTNDFINEKIKNKTYLCSEFSLNTKGPKLFYDLSENEQII